MLDDAKFCAACGTPVEAGAGGAPNAAPQPPPAAASAVPPDWAAAVAGRPDRPRTQGPTGELPEYREAPSLHAGFWMRVVAWLIDYVIEIVGVVIIAFAVGVLYGILAKASGHAASRDLARLMGQVIGLVGGWLYYALFESSHLQATPGKLALGLRVTDLNGGRIGFGRATGRYFGKIISGLILLIGFMMAGWTSRKQALHDMMAGCCVVRKSELERFEAGGYTDSANSSRSGGMPGWAIALVVVGALIFPVAILAAIAIPAYQNYLVRSQVAEGVTLADGAKVAVAEYDANNNAFPTSNAQVGMGEPDSITGKYVGAVTVGTLQDGTGAIKVDFSDAANSALHGKYLLLEAQPQADGSLHWTCKDSSIAAKYLPTSCRSDDD